MNLRSKAVLQESPEADFVATVLYRTYLLAKEQGMNITLQEFLRKTLQSHTALRHIGAMWRGQA